MKKFVKAVLITTFLAVLTRALGLLIKIYISREIGAEALGYYQISLSVFFLLCTLVTSGIPLVISRLTAKDPKNKYKIVFSGLVVSTIIAFIVCGFVIAFPRVFASLWGQKKSLSVLFALLPSVIFTSLYVPFRGALWGNKEFFILGFIELIEQIFRFVSLVIFFSLSLSLTGELTAGITYSIACGLSSVVAILWYFIKGNKLKPSLKFVKPLLKESTPIAIVRIGSSVTTLIISLVMPLKLALSGITQAEAISQFGVVTGMVLPLLTIPGTLISSIAVALIPDISGSKIEHTKKQINRAINYSLIISFLLLPTFMVLGKELGVLLYKDELAGNLLATGSILLLPLGLSQISSSILNAIGKEMRGLINYIVGAVILIICITVLPQFMGIYALVLGFLLMSTINTLLNFLSISSYLNIVPLKTFFFSVLCTLVSALFAYFTFGTLQNFLPQIFAIIIASGVSIFMMLSLYQIFKFIDIKDFLPQKSNVGA